MKIGVTAEKEQTSKFLSLAFVRKDSCWQLSIVYQLGLNLATKNPNSRNKNCLKAEIYFFHTKGA